MQTEQSPARLGSGECLVGAECSHEIQALIARAPELLVVVSEESAKMALECAITCRTIQKNLEAKRLEVTRPALEFQRRIKERHAAIETQLSSLEKSLQSKLQYWMEKESDNPFLKIDKLEISEGTISISEKWTYYIVDENEIPEEYFVKRVDYSKVDDLIKKGVRNIPGIKIFKQKTSQIRTKRSNNE